MKLSICFTKKESKLAWVCLLLSLFGLPYLLGLANDLLPEPLSAAHLNILYFFLNFLLVVTVFRCFLWKSLKAVFAHPWQCLRIACLGYLGYRAATIVISLVILEVYPDFSNVNDDSIFELARENYGLMALSTIFLVPVAEETLYRGVVFQSLHRKSRLLAYLVSTVVFAGIHIVGYIGQFDLLTLLLCFTQYLPAGLLLGWAYEKADTIAVPILMHITINQVSMFQMR